MNRAGFQLAWRLSGSSQVGNCSQLGMNVIRSATRKNTSQISRRISSSLSNFTKAQTSPSSKSIEAISTVRQRIAGLLHGRFYATANNSNRPQRPTGQRLAHPDLDPTSRSSRRQRTTEDATPEPEQKPCPEPQEKDTRSRSERLRTLISPTVFTIIVCAGSYYYAQTYVPPKFSERMFPEYHQADVTVWTIIGLNAAVFLLWRVPIPLNWKILNKYFISSAMKPNALSMIGNAFSHQQVMHIFMNMYVLHSFGTIICDELGRGKFLGLYISSCVVSSLASTWYSVLFRTALNVHALGASGAIMAVIGTFIQHHPSAEISIIFLPFIKMTAEQAALIFGAFEVAGLVFRWHFLDHMAHLSGLVYGFLLAKYIDSRRRVNRHYLGARRER